MEISNLNLTLDNHPSKIISVLKGALHTRSFVDLIVKAGGKKFYVHKFILSLSSNYFAERHNDDVVHVDNTSAEVMAAILNLIYGGEASLPVELLEELNEAIRRLEVSKDLLNRDWIRIEAGTMSDVIKGRGTNEEGEASTRENLNHTWPSKSSFLSPSLQSSTPKVHQAKTKPAKFTKSEDDHHQEDLPKKKRRKRRSAPAKKTEAAEDEVDDDIVDGFPCDHCEVVLENLDMRKQHTSVMHKKGEEEEKGDDTFGDEFKNSPLVTSDNESSKDFMCEECGKSFRQKSRMKAHITRMHINMNDKKKKKEHQCYVCDHAFYQRKDLKDHSRTDHGIDLDEEEVERPEKENEDQEEEEDKDRSEEDKENDKTNEDYSAVDEEDDEDDDDGDFDDVFKCSQCPKKYKSRTSLYCHRKNKHGNNKHKCPDCEKSFPFPSTLKIHSKKHANATSSLSPSPPVPEAKKDFACKFCDKAYPLQAALNFHMTRCAQRTEV